MYKLTERLKENKVDIAQRVLQFLALGGMLALLFGAAVLADTTKQRDALITVTNELQEDLSNVTTELDSIKVAYADLSSNTEKALAENQELKSQNETLTGDKETLNAEVERLKKLLRTLE